MSGDRCSYFVHAGRFALRTVKPSTGREFNPSKPRPSVCDTSHVYVRIVYRPADFRQNSVWVGTWAVSEQESVDRSDAINPGLEIAEMDRNGKKPGNRAG